jgi:hydroxymethylpyrimidine pyrophosphatase-like HAD family hydrolase
MPFQALACDYDGTLATDGHVAPETAAAVEELRRLGWKILLVTGRQLFQLFEIAPDLRMFHLVVAENGALLYYPTTGREELLASAPPDQLLLGLRDRGASFSVGRVVVDTRRPHDTAVEEVLRESGIPWQIIYNKNAVMVLPQGVDKTLGLRRALESLGIPPQETVGIGDAENDLTFLRLCGFSAAVANALAVVKDTADLVLERDHGAGVVELVERLLAGNIMPRHVPRPATNGTSKMPQPLHAGTEPQSGR